MSKADLRKIFKDRRAQMSQNEVFERSEDVCLNFLKNLFPKIYQQNNSGIFSIYLPSGNEVSTALISDFFKKNHVRFSYPKIVAKNQPLEFIICDQDTEFLSNQFYPNILEPKVGEKILPDFLIIPLVAFDLNLSRIGMGGGFFDRTIQFLKSKKSQITTIGLAFDFQQLEGVAPLENTDCALDFIVTEKNIFLPNQE